MQTYTITTSKNHLNPDPKVFPAKAENIDNLRRNLIAKREEIGQMFYGPYADDILFQIAKGNKVYGTLRVSRYLGKPMWFPYGGHEDGKFHIVDPQTGKLESRIEGFGSPKTEFAIYRNGKRQDLSKLKGRL